MRLQYQSKYKFDKELYSLQYKQVVALNVLMYQVICLCLQ